MFDSDTPQFNIFFDLRYKKLVPQTNHNGGSLVDFFFFGLHPILFICSQYAMAHLVVEFFID